MTIEEAIAHSREKEFKINKEADDKTRVIIMNSIDDQLRAIINCQQKVHHDLMQQLLPCYGYVGNSFEELHQNVKNDAYVKIMRMVPDPGGEGEDWVLYEDEEGNRFCAFLIRWVDGPIKEN